jgi:large subunit ribosomal protein L4e
MARGHRVSAVNEVPLVVANDIESITKTKEALALLKSINAMDDVEHVKDSKKIRRGKGKMRNRRYVMRKGPLVVYANNNGVEQSFRNIPGVEIACVDRLNLLKLAPGGHLGRFVIWSQAAFEKLDAIFGTSTTASEVKKTFTLPRSMMANADLARIINSDEIQSKVRAAKEGFAKPSRKRNPLRNLGTMLKLNPYIAEVRRAELARAGKKKAAPKAAKKIAKKSRDAKLVNRAKYLETLRATPETPAASFLDSYNKVRDTTVEQVESTKKAKK